MCVFFTSFFSKKIRGAAIETVLFAESHRGRFQKASRSGAGVHVPAASGVSRLRMPAPSAIMTMFPLYNDGIVPVLVRVRVAFDGECAKQ